MPNFAVGFNVSRWWRSSFKFNNYYAKGLVQAPSADALYDSSNSFAQQIKVHDCTSSHAQENFIEFTQCWATDIDNNTIERGNGGIDLQRSSGQSAFRLRVRGNTLQANGGNLPFVCNFGVGFTFSGNYFESNRASSGVLNVQVRMSANNTQDLNSLVFQGNFFASGAAANLDGVGAEYAHVHLDAFNNFYPKSNDFTGGNGYKMSNSTGLVYSENETYTPVGSIYSEGNVTIASSAIPGVIELPSVYQDDQMESKIEVSKIAAGIPGQTTFQSFRIPTGTSHDFRMMPKGIFFLSAQFTDDSVVQFSGVSTGVAPLLMSEPVGGRFDLSASPAVPAAGRCDVAVNAAGDRLTVYNNIGTDRNFNLVQIGNNDWIV
jgi:hypothetical protein